MIQGIGPTSPQYHGGMPPEQMSQPERRSASASCTAALQGHDGFDLDETQKRKLNEVLKQVKDNTISYEDFAARFEQITGREPTR